MVYFQQSESPSEFSFDLYPGLCDELNKAYTRNVKQGMVSPENAAIAGLTSVVQHNLPRQSEISLSEKVQGWLGRELGGNSDNGVLRKWQRYDSLMSVPIPDLDILNSPKMAETYNRLYEAKLALDTSSETTPSGEPIGETMHMVAVPWQAFKENVDRLPQWINHLRSRQGMNEADNIEDELLEAITSDTPMYKSWDNPGILYTAREYLDHRISHDGPWGVMLVQTSNDASVRNFVDKSPNQLTSYGQKCLEIAGQQVDSFGIFEWLALTLQEDPKQLSSQDYSWLLANRMEVRGGSRVPFGYWRNNQVRLVLGSPGIWTSYARPRLAVLA